MSLEGMLREAVLAAAPELVALVRADLGRPRMIPIEETGVSRRVLNAAAADGDIELFRIGHAVFVDSSAFYEFVRRAGAKPPSTDAAPTDEIGELIAIGDRRRSRRKAGK